MDNKPANDKQKLDEFSWIEPVGIKHPDIVLLGQLVNNKKVENEYLFAIEGLWAYEKILQGSVKIKTFVFCPEYVKNMHISEIVRALIGIAENTYTISNKICERISGRDGAEGFFMLCEMPQYKLDDIELKDNNLIVILDGLEKPGNVGTIIRAIDGAGGDAVILVNRKARIFNHEMIKSSMGSSFMMPVIGAEISETAEWLKKKGFRIILTDLRAKEYYYNINFKGKIAVVAGNERHGISEEWHSYNCERVIIPMLGGADSLNVGVATALVTYEASLQQRGMIKRM